VDEIIYLFPGGQDSRKEDIDKKTGYFCIKRRRYEATADRADQQNMQTLTDEQILHIEKTGAYNTIILTKSNAIRRRESPSKRYSVI
jgi:hypothetical protein